MEWLYKHHSFKSLLLELRLFGYYHFSRQEIAVHFTRHRGKISLSFVNFNLPAIPKSIFNFRISNLNLSQNNINYIFDEIGQLTDLRYLDLSFNQITDIPKIFNEFTKLTLLNLSNNKLQEINIDFSRLTLIENLNLANNNIEVTPASIWDLHLLRTIDLSHNKIKSIHEITGLKDIRELWLNDNLIEELPESLGNLKKIKILHLENNKLRKIPDKILINIQNYHYFDASHNDTQSILRNMGKNVLDEIEKSLDREFELLEYSFPNLENMVPKQLFVKIYLELMLLNIDSPIERIASRITILKDKTLELNLYKLKINTFPSTLCEIPNISVLRMPLSIVKTLPLNLHHLRDLKVLKCWNSKDDRVFDLENAPESICRFINLEELNLWFNKVQSLPHNIGNLKKLKRLILGFNDLERLPKSVEKLNNLEELDIRGNSDLTFTNWNPKMMIKK